MFKIPNPETRREDQLHNAILARELWQERVSEDEVDLGHWKCGTQACFGGHLGMWPEFRNLPGALQESWGTPHFEDPNAKVDIILFGELMFYAEQPSENGKRQHDIITARLDWVIESLSQPAPPAQNQE
jgi:hypothetical protein